jgi:hypothetical protein
MFIKFKNERVVNLDNVSTIKIVNGSNGDYKRVIFNLDYGITISKNKIIPDYVYWNVIDESEFDTIQDIFNVTLEDNWINISDTEIININKVSSIVERPSENRVIFNFNFSISQPSMQNRLTSSFVFVDFDSENEYEDFLEDLYENMIDIEEG